MFLWDFRRNQGAHLGTWDFDGTNCDKGGKRSLCEISAELAAAGYTTKSGTPYAATAIKLMLERH
ncbi:hypothetical protein Q2941_25330 [Bradyrhizobium sp. UFLA05-153]